MEKKKQYLQLKLRIVLTLLFFWIAGTVLKITLHSPVIAILGWWVFAYPTLKLLYLKSKDEEVTGIKHVLYKWAFWHLMLCSVGASIGIPAISIYLTFFK